MAIEVTRSVGETPAQPIRLPVNYTAELTIQDGLQVTLRCEVRGTNRTLQIITAKGVTPFAVCSMTPSAVQFFVGGLRIALNEFLEYIDREEAGGPF